MLLEVNNLHSFYGSSHVLQGVDLSIQEGQVVSLLGRNGMGKTTLIRSMMHMTPPTVRDGTVLYRGEDITGSPSHSIAKRGLGLVPQGRRIFPSLSVRENLTLAHRSAPEDVENPPRKWTLERVFELFPQLRDRVSNRGNQLSGGEQQMLAIGRTLMTNPVLMLMDEPSEGLAPMIVDQLEEHIGHLKETGLSIFLVEQNLGLALDVADYVYILERGEIVYEDDPAPIRDDEELQQKFIGV